MKNILKLFAKRFAGVALAAGMVAASAAHGADIAFGVTEDMMDRNSGITSATDFTFWVGRCRLESAGDRANPENRYGDAVPYEAEYVITKNGATPSAARTAGIVGRGFSTNGIVRVKSNCLVIFSGSALSSDDCIYIAEKMTTHPVYSNYIDSITLEFSGRRNVMFPMPKSDALNGGYDGTDGRGHFWCAPVGFGSPQYAGYVTCVLNDDRRTPDPLWQCRIGEAKYGTLAAALAAAQPGDTILFKRDLDLDRTVTIDKDVTLAVDGDGAVPVRRLGNFGFDIRANVVVSNLTVKGFDVAATRPMFDVAAGASLTLAGSTEVNGCVNTSGNGGAIRSAGAVVLDGARIARCSANVGGAIYAMGSIDGAVTNRSAIVLNNARIEACSAATFGGAVFLMNGTVTATGGAISGCSAATRGGGAVYLAANAAMTVAGGFRATDNTVNGAAGNIERVEQAQLTAAADFTGTVGVVYPAEEPEGAAFGVVADPAAALAGTFRYDLSPRKVEAVVDDGRLVWRKYDWAVETAVALVPTALDSVAYSGAEATVLPGGDVVLVFTNAAAAGSFTLASNVYARILCVGGGAAGGTVGLGVTAGAAGGGGAGGFYEMEKVALAAGAYTVSVGEGAHRVDSYAQSWVGNNGGASWVQSAVENGDYVISAKGGGGGAAPKANGVAVAGGSGGGGSWWGSHALACGVATDGYGWKGGTPTSADFGGGGGGAATNKVDGLAAGRGQATGAGGAGRASDITGETVVYAPGGRGGDRTDPSYRPQDGAAFGAGGDGAGAPGKGGAGADGIVVVRLMKSYTPVKVPYPAFDNSLPWEEGKTVSPFGDDLASDTNRTFIAAIDGAVEAVCTEANRDGERYSFTVTLKDGYEWDDPSAEDVTKPAEFLWRVARPGEEGHATTFLRKTVRWVGDSSNAVIHITGHTTPELIDQVPRVLVIGTLCNAHRLTADTVTAAVNAAAKVADVDYFLYKNAQTATSVTPALEGSLARGEQYPDSTWVGGLFQSQHNAIYAFYDRLAKVIDAGTQYDYILMGFDRALVADSLRTAHPREAEVAAYLKPFYEKGRVLWMIDNSDSGLTDFEPALWQSPWYPSQLVCYVFGWTTYYIQSSRAGHTYYDATQDATYRATAWLRHKALFGMFDPAAYETLDEQAFYANLITDTMNIDLAKHAATSGRANPNQVVYDDAGNVVDLVSRLVQPVAYTVVLNDDVHVARGLALDGVTGTWNTNTQETAWNELVEGEHFTLTETGVRLAISNLTTDVWIDLDLHVHDTGSFRTSVDAKYNPATGLWEKDPNDGDAMAYTESMTEGHTEKTSEDSWGTETGWTFRGFELTGVVASNTNGLMTGDILVNGYSTNRVAVGTGSSPQEVFRAAPGYILDRLEIDGEPVAFNLLTCDWTFPYVSADHDVKVWYRPYFVMDPPPPVTGPVTNVYDGTGYGPTVTNVCFSDDIPYPWYPVYSMESNGVYSVDGGQTNVVYDADGNVTSTNVYVRIAVLQPGYDDPVILDNWTGVNTVTILPREITVKFDDQVQTNATRLTEFPYHLVDGELVPGDELLGTGTCTNLPAMGPTVSVGSITSSTDPSVTELEVTDHDGAGGSTTRTEPIDPIRVETPDYGTGNYIVHIVPGDYYYPGDNDSRAVSTGDEKTYDGTPSSITVTPQVPPSAKGYEITYTTTEGGDYGPENPTFTHAGTNTVYWQVTVTNYDGTVTTHTGSDTVIITPRPVTVTAADAMKYYDGTPLVTNGFTVAEATATTGFVDGEGLASVTMTGESSQTQPGTRPNVIDPAGSTGLPGTDLGDYAITYLPGTLTVKDRIVSVPTDVEKTYDGERSGIGVTVSTSTDPATPLDPGEYTIKYSIDPDDPESWTNELSFLDVGISNQVWYVVEMPGYDPVTNSAYVTIHPREIVVTADDKTKLVGDPDPAFTWTVTGGTNAQGVAVGILPGEEELVRAAVAADANHAIAREPGEEVTSETNPPYPITPSGSEYLGNYHVTYVPGKLTIATSILAYSNIHGLLQINSPFESTIIPAPWKGYTRDGAPTLDIPVDRMVKPRNLTEDDLLLQYANGGVYKAWTLERDEETGEGRWTPLNTVAQVPELVGGTTNVVVERYVRPTGGETQRRGYGLWLLRQRPYEVVGGVTNVIPFYLYGQWMTGAETITVGGIDANDVGIEYTYSKYGIVHDTMLANPDCTRGTSINAYDWTGFDTNDTIIVNTDLRQSIYCFRRERAKRAGGGWYDGWWFYGRTADGGIGYRNDITTPPGVGFWYERRVTGDMTLTWAGDPQYPGDGEDHDVWIVDHADAGDGRTHLAIKLEGSLVPAGGLTEAYIRELFDAGCIRYLHATGTTQAAGKQMMDELTEALPESARPVPYLRNGTGVNTPEELAKGWIWVTVDATDGTNPKTDRDGTGDTNGAGDLWRIVVGKGVWAPPPPKTIEYTVECVESTTGVSLIETPITGNGVEGETITMDLPELSPLFAGYVFGGVWEGGTYDPVSGKISFELTDDGDGTHNVLLVYDEP